MIEVFENQIIDQGRQSSKGNQLKWFDGKLWYKADYVGYEGLAEYVISHLLQKSNLKPEEFVLYDLEQIRYKSQLYNGCKSSNFLAENWQLITLEHLFKNYTGRGLNGGIYSITNKEARLRFLVEQTERMTGIKDFGKYISKVLTIDTFFLNEDRHTHNIAVLMDNHGDYGLCPIFDQGAGLLSDITMDYPLHEDVYKLEDTVKPKTFCEDFDVQLDIAEKLYGQQLEFYFTKKDVDAILNTIEYDPVIKERVRTLLYNRMRKFRYLMK